VGFKTDTRGAASQVVQVLTAGITALLISGLVLGAGTYLEGQQERATQEELNVVGERMASELSKVSAAADPGKNEITLNVNHVDDIAGEQYLVELTTEDDPDNVCERRPGPVADAPESCLRLWVPTTDVEVVVGLGIDKGKVKRSTIVGGSVEIVYDGSRVTIKGGDGS
jgi:hypothetical protein